MKKSEAYLLHELGDTLMHKPHASLVNNHVHITKHTTQKKIIYAHKSRVTLIINCCWSVIVQQL